MVLVSASVVYNTLQDEVPPVYTVEVEWTYTDGQGPVVWECGISVKEKGRRLTDANDGRALSKARPGMLLADIGVFTGFVTAGVEQQLRASPGGWAVKRVEVGPYGNVLIYLSGEVEGLSFTALEVFAVANRVAATSKVIDYYAPERMGSAATSILDAKVKVQSWAVTAGLGAVVAIALMTAP
jgi:hypothetical protein